MEKIGIICEYNPFHNGHVHHLNAIKKMYPDSLIVLVMSGYFTERGDISIISKYNKTRIALDYGIDIVLELPVLFSLNSADYFAEASMEILNAIGVDRIIFGSETDDVDMLKSAALSQCDEKFQDSIKESLATGVNYPTALSRVLDCKYESNDILAIAYIKAIIKNNYKIEVNTIKRTNSFNDLNLDEKIVSAENIREKILNGKDISKYIPKYDKSFMNSINYDKMFELLKYRIISEKDLSIYLGVDEGIQNKIKKEIDDAINLDDLINKVKSKRYTYVRIKRMFIHILLGIRKEDMKGKNECIRILGFNQIGKSYLKKLDSDKLVHKYDGRIRDIEITAAKIYYLLTNDESTCEEYKNKPVIKE